MKLGIAPFNIPQEDHKHVLSKLHTVNPKKLETGLRTNSAGIPYTLLLRIEAVGFPTFGLLLYGCLYNCFLLWGSFERFGARSGAGGASCDAAAVRTPEIA